MYNGALKALVSVGSKGKMEVLESNKGTTAIVVDSYKFVRDKNRKEHITWRCSVRSCKSRCTTTHDMQILAPPTEHNHNKIHESTLNLTKVRSAVKRKALESPNKSVGKLVCKEAVQYESKTYSDVKDLKNSVNACRLKHRPPLPKNVEEVYTVLETINVDEFK